MVADDGQPPTTARQRAADGLLFPIAGKGDGQPEDLHYAPSSAARRASKSSIMSWSPATSPTSSATAPVLPATDWTGAATFTCAPASMPASLLFSASVKALVSASPS